MSIVSTKSLLREMIELLLITESPKSDAFEQSIAASINSKFKGTGIKASRPPADTSLPDVLVTVQDVGDSFIEVKMSHTDNLANPRVFFDGARWATTYKTPVAKYAVELLNSSDQSQKFIKDLSRFVKRKNVKLSTTIGGLKEPGVVSLAEMVKFVTAKGNRYIVNEPDVDLGNLVTQHYTQGKSQAAHYLQAGDDFYMIGNSDALGLNAVNGGGIPVLSGTGEFKVRVSTRSAFYEIQTELKIKHYEPASSPYSVLKGSKKINPFTALAEKIEANPPPASLTRRVKKH
jgi:hypothetical protein